MELINNKDFMACKNCVEEPVIELSNSDKSLCKNCFIRYFEKKVLKTIKKYGLIEDNERIGVAVSGGKDSLSVLSILTKLQKKYKNIWLTAIAIDEGIAGYRILDDLKDYCKMENITLEIVSFKDEFGISLDEALKKVDIKACSICGVLRRSLLNRKARELKLDKLATGHNLDDEAQSVMMNYLKGNNEKSIRLGPKTSLVVDSRFIPRIKPLYFMSEKEVATYAFLKKFPVKFNECPNTAGAYREVVRNMLNDIEMKYPGTKYGIISSFLELLPSLLKTYSGKKANSCTKCDEPSSKDVCNTCKMLDLISI
ncbi:MAG: TIGR00269 family protein [Nanoarchaeota archaeon]